MIVLVVYPVKLLNHGVGYFPLLRKGKIQELLAKLLNVGETSPRRVGEVTNLLGLVTDFTGLRTGYPEFDFSSLAIALVRSVNWGCV